MDSQVIGYRYQLLDKLGQGGMGSVYKAYDRLNRQFVALKQVVAKTGFPSSPVDDSESIRLSLAHEFQTLASLHHPHVIGVLDYGFDASKQPYFTMSLVHPSQPITQAAQGQSPATKVKLLIQMLQALAYLHRRGIIHRDLKPDNALVTADGEVKVLDFGLAILREQRRDDDSISGTLAYMAPEMVLGTPANETTDLYAVGVMAYEMFAGRHPFSVEKPGQLIQQILASAVDLDRVDANDAIKEIIGRLLDKSSDRRYSGDAYAVIWALSEALNQPAPQESAAIRESFLQAAQFVGRETELVRLTGALEQALLSHGSVWLIGGESGVGKSRLLEELRTRALVRGALVLHGQGIAEGGLPYHLWREPLRRLVLSAEISDAEASILKQIVPDIDDLLGHEIPSAPALEGEAGQQRLFRVISGILHRQQQPTVLILEDLQWTTESLSLLEVLIPLTKELSLLIVASYRDDEAPQLPERLSGTQVIKLERLNDKEIKQLSGSMLGEAGIQSEMVAFLKRETEGNVFFLVEVVRALAEEAGGLSEVGRMTLPARVFAGGVQQVVQRRLQSLPDSARHMLQMAAVIGRQLDLGLLGLLASDINLDEWLATCSNAAVLELVEERWRFSHDKFREGVLSALPTDERQRLHKQVAVAAETLYAHAQDEYAGMIADHYEQAGEQAVAAHWHARAGQHARATYAPEIATIHYQKALSFWANDMPESQRLEVYKGLGHMLQWQARYVEALETFKQMQQAAQAVGDLSSQAYAWCGIAGAQLRQGQVRLALESAAQAEEAARGAAAHHALTTALYMKGLCQFRLGNVQAALELSEQVLALSTQMENRPRMAQSLNLLGGAHFSLGQLDEADRHFQRALAIFQELGDRSEVMILMNNLGWLAGARGDYQTAFSQYEAALAIAREIADRDSEIVFLCNLGGARVALGDYEAAEADLLEVIRMAAVTPFRELSEAYRFLAEAYLGQNKTDDAFTTAQRALALGVEVESQEYIGVAWRVLGQIAAQKSAPLLIENGGQAQLYDAVACFTESARICQENGLDGERARTLREWAKYELQHGDGARGANLWQEARDLFVRLTAHLEAERMGDLPAASAR